MTTWHVTTESLYATTLQTYATTGNELTSTAGVSMYTDDFIMRLITRMIPWWRQTWTLAQQRVGRAVASEQKEVSGLRT